MEFGNGDDDDEDDDNDEMEMVEFKLDKTKNAENKFCFVQEKYLFYFYVCKEHTIALNSTMEGIWSRHPETVRRFETIRIGCWHVKDLPFIVVILFCMKSPLIRLFALTQIHTQQMKTNK